MEREARAGGASGAGEGAPQAQRANGAGRGEGVASKRRGARGPRKRSEQMERGGEKA